MLNLSENGDYNPNMFWINKIPKIFLCVYLHLHIVDIPAQSYGKKLRYFVLVNVLADDQTADVQ